MAIVLARIDDRLIHGQVVEGWIKSISADHIIIVSDEVANDRMQQALLGMAVPDEIAVSSLSIDDAALKFKNGYFDKQNVLLLFSRPHDVLRLLKSGLVIKSLNVGGMHYVPGKKQILRTLSVDDSDVLALREISGMGIEMDGRILPGDERINIMDILENNLKL